MPRPASRRLDRLGALSGVLMVVLTFGGFALLGTAAGGLLDLTSSREEVVRHFADPVPALFWVGGYLEVVGVVLFIPFAAYLTGVFRRVDGEGSWLPSTVFGSALFFVVSGVVSFSAGATAYYHAGEGVHPDVLLALAHLRSFAFTIGWAVAALFLATSATVILSRNVLPRWLGWTAIALAAALLAGLATPTSDVAQTPPMLMALWVLAVSVTLLRQPEAFAASRAPAATQP
jgi:hypothetical protein